MKIQICTKNNVNNTSMPNNIYLGPKSTQISSPIKDVVSFGHYLDDELNKKIKKIEDTEKDIQKVNSDTNKLRQDSAVTSQQLEAKINQKKGSNEALSGQIKKLADTGTQKDIEIKEVKSKSYVYEQEINASKRESENLRVKQDQLLEKIRKEREIAEIERKEKVNEATTKANEAFKQKKKAALSGPKNTLIQRVFNPIIIENKGGKAIVPSGILIESESLSSAKNTFEWVIRKTNSNYAVINAKSFEDNPQLFKKISNIAKKSQKQFEKHKTRTFTIIENFEHCASPKPENYPIIGALKDYLDTCSTDFYNTLVVLTKDPSKLDAIVSADHRFQVKIKLDKFYLQNNEIGYSSILNEIKETKIIGKDLSVSAFRRLYNNLFKQIKIF